MTLQILGSGSSGNCYILTSDSGQILIIECGVKWSKIQEAIDFDYSSVIGCLASHSHLDHIGSGKQCVAAGINIYTGKETIASSRFESHRLHEIKPEVEFTLGEYKILPLPVDHDVPCLSFVIGHKELGKLLFVTDTIMLPYKVPGLTNIMLEANFSNEILNERDLAGQIHSRLRDRVIQSHLSIETAKQLLAANDITKVNNIIMLHLSQTNSDAVDFKRQIEELTHKTVHIAMPGMTLNFNRRPW